jgi:hypothetical protein
VSSAIIQGQGYYVRRTAGVIVELRSRILHGVRSRASCEEDVTERAHCVADVLVAIRGTLCVAQSVESQRPVLVRDVHCSGDLGASPKQLHDYTEFLIGHRLERKKILERASSATTMLLHHQGYWKTRVTPELRSLGSRSEHQEVSLEIVVRAGKQYRVKDLKFVGLAGQLPETELNQTCHLRRAEKHRTCYGT